MLAPPKDVDIQAIVNENSFETASMTTASELPRLGTGIIDLKASDSTNALFHEFTHKLKSGKYKDDSEALNVAVWKWPDNIPPRVSF